MHHLLVTLGSHGDTHPFIGIGRRLLARGHRVTLAANGAFESMVRTAGLEFAELGTAEEFGKALAMPDLWHPTKGPRIVFEHGILPAMPRTYELIRSLYVPGETVVTAHAIAFGARVAQEKLGLPLATVHLAPVVFRDANRPPIYGNGNRFMQYTPTWFNRILFRVVVDALVMDRIVAKPLNAFRAGLGLKPVKRIIDEWWNSPGLVLGLFPEWFARCEPGWPRQLRLTGFPLFDEAGTHILPPDVEAFLAGGEPPIVFTFGSAHSHAREELAVSAEACRQLNRRGLLLTRFPDQVPTNLPPGVRHVAYAPFSELLPRCAAIVHHGGIGTTSQGLAAGIPQIIAPFAHDQFDNAARIRNLGCGFELKRYRAKDLVAQLKEILTHPSIIQNCRSAAKKLATADPLGETCDFIEHVTPP